MRKVLCFFFLFSLTNIWALHCSKSEDITINSDFSKVFSLQITGNNSGVFCVGWMEGERITKKEVLKVSQKFLNSDWSEPQIISRRDDIMWIDQFKFSVNENGDTFALWEMNQEVEELSDIFFSIKHHNTSWENPTCLMKNISELDFVFEQTRDGHSYVVCKEFDEFESRDRIKAHSFYLGKKLDESHLDIITPGSIEDMNFFTKSKGLTTLWWMYSTINKEDFVEYCQIQQDNWSDIHTIKQLKRFPKLEKRPYNHFFEEYFQVFYNRKVFVGGSPYDLAILLALNSDGKIFAASSQSLFFENLGKKNDRLESLSIIVDKKENVCAVWQINRLDQIGIGVAIKLKGKRWETPLELFPPNGKYKQPEVVGGPGGHFVIAWEKHLNDESCILGTTFDINKMELSPISQLSPWGEKCVDPSLFFPEKGNGYIAWLIEKDYFTKSIQVAELHF